MTPRRRGITVFVHAETKVGKSTFSVTSPYPRLYLDVEAASEFLPIVPTYWDPKKEDPPTPDGTWDTCIVDTRDYDTLLKVYQWLQIGRHGFKSLIIDSLSELQAKCMEQLVGRNQMKTQDWGDLGRTFTGLMRDLRDLKTHPTNPLEAVVVTAMTRERDGKMVPYLQGQSGTVGPYLFDVTGFLAKEQYPNEDPTQPPYTVRRMYIDSAHPRYLAGERVQGKLGTIVEQGDLSVDGWLNTIFGPREAPSTQLAS
jgi:hypothetical protein